MEGDYRLVWAEMELGVYTERYRKQLGGSIRGCEEGFVKTNIS